MVIPAMLSKAELATAMPKAGGDYFFVDRSMGAGFGTLAGFAAWFSLCFKSAFALLGIGAFGTLLYPDLTMGHIKFIAMACCLLFGLINFLGVDHAGRFQVGLVVGLLTLLTLYVARGVSHVQLDNFHPFMKGSVRDLFATAGLIFVSYGGLTKIASVAEETKNPGRNLPLAMIVATAVVSIFYVIALFVTVGVLGNDLIHPSGAPSLTPISDSAYVFMSSWGRNALAIAAMLAFITTGNAGIMAASRTPLAMSRDKLLPQFFGSVHNTFKTPHTSIFYTVLFMVAIILFLDLELLVKTASTLKILLFATVNLAVIIMRESGIENYQPKFRTPWYPWLQIAGTVGYIVLLMDMGMVPLTISLVFLGLGLAWYWIYGRIHALRQSALVHLVRRITPKELTSYSLNTELEAILVERDTEGDDRFYRLVKNAPILELPYALKMEDAFTTFAERLSERVDLPAKQIYERLLARELDVTTVVAPGLAIPHILLPGNNKFDMLLVRCQEGILFSPDIEPVYACFVLAGTHDERHFHLRALMSIAELVQKPGFVDAWLQAKRPKELRKIVLQEA
jgi:amino acid transporter/mannitol/fructose-specific phosphotransferase system IIA component (Ntr-type)